MAKVIQEGDATVIMVVDTDGEDIRLHTIGEQDVASLVFRVKPDDILDHPHAHQKSMDFGAPQDLCCTKLKVLSPFTRDGARTEALLTFGNGAWEAVLRLRDDAKDIIAAYQQAGCEHVTPRVVPQGCLSKLGDQIRIKTLSLRARLLL